ncbi:carboxypeptidase-like regulatory domain-containing protein [Pontibacter actiniarum]|uniref:TonB-dependent receptor n=1 Tax=Pontibacter actiniarum TaxID=323450 RepID=A0A1X9YSY7_9BACT|nr:carboxypeptidase-like regulatory domain-containing protein [Pontibacter actiniarum]ARS35962.1 hypothetical protein CA264_11230 [Pontibacter actiniarum]
MKTIKLFLLLLLLSSYASAQTLLFKGKVIDRFQKKPVPFATIGIKGKSLGTVAGENGEFQFSVPATAVSDEEQIVVSCVGYKNVAVPVSAFIGGQ